MTRGLRALSKSPGYFALAVMTLALGVGSATVMFSVTESALWRPLPFPSPERLVMVTEVDRKSVAGSAPVTRAQFVAWRGRQRSFSTLAATGWGATHNITGAGLGERIRTQSVTANFFTALGVAAALGRDFTAAEETADARRVMLTDAYWRSRFGASADVIGEAVKLDGDAYTIAGVLPKAFHLDFTSDPDVYLPLDLSKKAGLRPQRELGVIGRLAPGVTIAAARAEMQALPRESAAGQEGGDWTVNVEDLRSAFNQFQRGPLLVFFGFAVLGLVVACANVAGLQLARYAGRRRESALRIALGANRLRLAREAAAESAWIALPGAGVGVLLSLWGMDGVRKFMPLGDFVRPEQIQMDAWTLVFVLAICGATVLLFALAPVFSAGKIDPIMALRSSKRGMGGRTEKRAGVFVMSEVAISFVLLFAAGLFVRTHMSLLETPLGFDARQVAAMRVSPGGAQRPSGGEMRTFARRVLETATAVPGVRKAAISGAVPL